MTKVKIFKAYDVDSLEEWINEFITTRNIIDIQYRHSGDAYKSYSAMIIYEDI